jgi:hypothetical protein
VTTKLLFARGTLPKKIDEVKRSGVPIGYSPDDFFDPKSLHHELVSRHMVMIGTLGRAEFWAETDPFPVPIIGELPWGTYYSKLVCVGVSGATPGKNSDTVWHKCAEILQIEGVEDLEGDWLTAGGCWDAKKKVATPLIFPKFPTKTDEVPCASHPNHPCVKLILWGSNPGPLNLKPAS